MFEDYHTICPTRRVFEYILEHLDETFAGEIKEKIELLKKLKTVSQMDRNYLQLVEHKLSLLKAEKSRVSHLATGLTTVPT